MVLDGWLSLPVERSVVLIEHTLVVSIVVRLLNVVTSVISLEVALLTFVSDGVSLLARDLLLEHA